MTPGDSNPGAEARQLCEQLRRRGETLSVAESCTGGWLGRELTSVPGASDVFWGGVIAYSNAAKTEFAEVPSDLIAEFGAVSRQTAVALADGVRRRSGSDHSISITGIAGPDGGLPDKPVGTVWIAVSGPRGTVARQYRFDGPRDSIRSAAVVAAIGLMLETLAD